MAVSSSEFWSSWPWPLATACLGLIFTALILSQWWRRRRPQQAAWAAGMLLYTVAAFMEAWSEGMGSWNPTIYRIYIVLAASLVGFLGLGTLYLLTHRRRWGHAYLILVLVMMAIFFYGTFTDTLLMDKLVPGITVGGQALGGSLSFPRVMSLPINITGSLLLFGGALYSVVCFLRRREYAYRMWGNVLIAAGAALLALLGSRARIGSTTGLYPAEMVGAALMLGGFLLAGTLEKGRKRVRALRNKAVAAREGGSEGE
jgi:hypothetical protein